MSAWATTLLGAVPEPDLDRDPPGRMIDVVCDCGERLALVTDGADGPHLTAWAPTVAVRATKTPPKYLAVASGPMPNGTALVTLHCFRHGHRTIEPPDLAHAVMRYRQTGKRQRVRTT